MIPKIIHYTWFSGDEMPKIVKDCMAKKIPLYKKYHKKNGLLVLFVRYDEE